MMNYKLEGLLTVEKFAERLSVKISTVRDWIARRKVPFTRFQRRVYFHTGVIEQMLQRAQVPALTASQDQRSSSKEVNDQGGAK
jgi:excisionase family DNA binding protein